MDGGAPRPTTLPEHDPHYTETVRQFTDYLADSGTVPPVKRIKLPHVYAYVARVQDTRSSATAALRYRSLQQFFRYLDGADVLEVLPVAKYESPPSTRL